MSGSLFEIAVLLLLITANGVFAMSELAMVSARKTRLKRLADEGSAGARQALELAEDPNEFLATVQIGITLVGILAGAYGGANLSRPLAAWLQQFPAVSPYREALAFGVVVAMITYLSLVIGELVPKQLALANAERIAVTVAGPMRFLSRAAAPLVRLLSGSTNLLFRLLGVRESGEPPVTEEEIKVLLGQATQAGVFEEAEEELVRRVFRLADQRVGALMTPRPEVDWLDLEEPEEEIRRKIGTDGRSRYPVGRGTLDAVVGIVVTRDLLRSCLSGAPLNLEQACDRPVFVPESMRALSVLDRLKQARSHAALVVDEYGGVQGLVTVTDLMEGIAGDLPSEDPGDEPEIVQREDGSWLLDGAIPASELRDVLGLKHHLPGEAEGAYHTLGGFLMAQFGRVPAAGYCLEWAGVRFEVLDMDGRRIDKVLAAPVEGEEASG